MNPYKKKRQAFFRKYFDYPSRFEAAVRETQPIDYFDRYVCGREIAILKRIDHPRYLIRMLNKYGYDRIFYWAHAFGEQNETWNWARLRWEPVEGLWLTYVMRCDHDVDFYRYQREKSECEHFYSTRRKLFSNFYPLTFLPLCESSGFSFLLTDNRLNPRVKWS